MVRLKSSWMVFSLLFILVASTFLNGCEKKENTDEPAATGQKQEEASESSTSPIAPPRYRDGDYGYGDKTSTESGSITLRITTQTCREGLVLNLVKDLNDGSKIADWFEIRRYFGSSLPEELERAGLSDKQAVWVTLNKQEFRPQGNRHYFIQRFDDGKPPDFLAHDQVGNIYLGSWYDLDIPVLITNP